MICFFCFLKINYTIILTNNVSVNKKLKKNAKKF